MIKETRGEVNGLSEKYDWSNIKKEYVTGKMSYKKLAEEHGIRLNTLTERAAEEGWVQERGRYREEIEQKTLEELQKKTARQNAKQRIRDSKEVNKVSSRLLEQVYVLVEKVKTPKELKSLTSALLDIQKLKGIKSEEDRKEQAARIKALLHSIEKDADKGPQEVKIVIEGDEEYAE